MRRLMLIAALLPPPAYAPDWQYMKDSEFGTQYYGDKHSVRSAGHDAQMIYGLWVTQIRHEATRLTYLEFDYLEMKFRELDGKQTSQDGYSVNINQTTWMRIEPGAPEGYIIAYACLFWSKPKN